MKQLLDYTKLSIMCQTIVLYVGESLTSQNSQWKMEIFALLIHSFIMNYNVLPKPLILKKYITQPTVENNILNPIYVTLQVALIIPIIPGISDHETVTAFYLHRLGVPVIQGKCIYITKVTMHHRHRNCSLI